MRQSRLALCLTCFRATRDAPAAPQHSPKAVACRGHYQDGEEEVYEPAARARRLRPAVGPPIPQNLR